MNLWKCLDAIFPYIEPLTDQQKTAHAEDLGNDISAIHAAKFSKDPGRALDEAQRVATAEIERSRTAESKATTYLAVLAALVPLIITLQAATWEDKSGPAPEWIKLSILLIATIYVAAAGYHAFRTLQVSGFQRVVERDVAAAWRTSTPLQRLTKSTLLASRMSRDAVNAKVTRIKATHQHLVRAFGAFVLLLSLDPAFYAASSIRDIIGLHTETMVEQANDSQKSKPQPTELPPTPDYGPNEFEESSESEVSAEAIARPEVSQSVNSDCNEGTQPE